MPCMHAYMHATGLRQISWVLSCTSSQIIARCEALHYPSLCLVCPLYILFVVRIFPFMMSSSCNSPVIESFYTILHNSNKSVPFRFPFQVLGNVLQLRRRLHLRLLGRSISMMAANTYAQLKLHTY